MICLFLFSKAGFGKELYRVEGLQWTMCDRSQLLWFNQHLLNVKGLQSTWKSENILCPATHTHTHTQKSQSNCHMKLDLVKFSDQLKYWLSSDMIIIHTQFTRDVLIRHITSNMIFKEYSLIKTLIFSTQKISLCPEE